MILYSKETNSFKITEKNKNSFDFKSPLDFSKTNLDNSKYEIYLFYNNQISENNILQVFNKDILLNSSPTRIGWIFSIQALFSNEHEFNENTHFLNYAMNSLYLFLKLLVNNNFENFENKLLSDDMDIENLCIFCLSKSTINNFNINHYIPSFYMWNFFYTPTFDYFSNTKFSSSNNNTIDFNSFKKIEISPISKLFQQNEKFINTLFFEIFPFNNNYLLEFMYCYQIIEFSIDELQKKKLNVLLMEMAHNKEPRKINELTRSISSMLKEDIRISKINDIVNKYRVNLLDLKLSCNTLLKKYNRECEGLHLQEYLYGVRNLLIHEFRVVKDLNELKIVVLHFKKFIVDLISIYDEKEEKTHKKLSKRKTKKYFKNS